MPHKMETTPLEEKALKRKDKLKALKRKKDAETQPNTDVNRDALELPK